jgi:hypothetical protein
MVAHLGRSRPAAGAGLAFSVGGDGMSGLLEQNVQRTRVPNHRRGASACFFLDNDLHFLENAPLVLVWFVLWDSVERLGERPP